MLDPQPNDETLSAIYGDMYFIGADRVGMRDQGNVLKRKTADLQLTEIKSYLNARPEINSKPQLLEVGCGLGNFLVQAHATGFDVQGIDVSNSAVATANAALGENLVRVGDLETADFKPQSFDVVVLADVIEHVRNPKQFVLHVRSLLKKGGMIFVAVPSLDSFSARIMGRYWVEFKLEHLFYFNQNSIKKLLSDNGFENIVVSPGRKVLSLDYIFGHFEKFPVPILTPIAGFLRKVLGKWILEYQIRLVASGINVQAQCNSNDEK